ncbi:alpha/beta fold hydrolase [Thermoplasma volcanium]|nr:alpha/beta hydrolase [Thermoplasma volcanium]
MSDQFVQVKSKKIHYIEEGSGIPIIMVHGARFSSETWVEVGTVSAVSSIPMRVISVDLPGYGRSEGGQWKDLRDFMNDFIDVLGIQKTALLGASLGGNVVASFAVSKPESVLALILVGAVGIRDLNADLSKLDGKPTLLIWGSKDTVSDRSNYETYMKYVKSSQFMNIGTNHACYFDDKNTFNNAVVSFLKKLRA